MEVAIISGLICSLNTNSVKISMIPGQCTECKIIDFIVYLGRKAKILKDW